MRSNRYKILVNANPSRPLTVGRGTFTVTEKTGKTLFILENDKPSGKSLLYTAEKTDVALENSPLPGNLLTTTSNRTLHRRLRNLNSVFQIS
jgi:hypothetical protein